VSICLDDTGGVGAAVAADDDDDQTAGCLSKLLVSSWLCRTKS